MENKLNYNSDYDIFNRESCIFIINIIFFIIDTSPHHKSSFIDSKNKNLLLDTQSIYLEQIRFLSSRIKELEKENNELVIGSKSSSINDYENGFRDGYEHFKIDQQKANVLIKILLECC